MIATEVVGDTTQVPKLAWGFSFPYTRTDGRCLFFPQFLDAATGNYVAQMTEAQLKEVHGITKPGIPRMNYACVASEYGPGGLQQITVDYTGKPSAHPAAEYTPGTAQDKPEMVFGVVASHPRFIYPSAWPFTPKLFKSIRDEWANGRLDYCPNEKAAGLDYMGNGIVAVRIPLESTLYNDIQAVDKFPTQAPGGPHHMPLLGIRISDEVGDPIQIPEDDATAYVDQGEMDLGATMSILVPESLFWNNPEPVVSFAEDYAGWPALDSQHKLGPSEPCSDGFEGGIHIPPAKPASGQAPRFDELHPQPPCQIVWGAEGAAGSVLTRQMPEGTWRAEIRVCREGGSGTATLQQVGTEGAVVFTNEESSSEFMEVVAEDPDTLVMYVSEGSGALRGGAMMDVTAAPTIRLAWAIDAVIEIEFTRVE